MRNLLLAGAICLLPTLAHAHAILVQSDPADGSTVAAGKHTLTLRYNSRIDRSLSRVTLNGTNAQLTLSPDGKSAPDTLSAPADLTPGTYVMHWQVLATDGHMTRGDVHFTVNAK